MARLNYYDIEVNGIKYVLDKNKDVGLSDPQVNTYVENEFAFSAEITPAIFVYLESREAPANMQRLAGGTRTDFILRFSLWCLNYHLDSIAGASEGRDELIGFAEIALMENRTLNGKVAHSWLEGGEFMTGESEAGFMSAGEIILVAEQKATT